MSTHCDTRIFSAWPSEPLLGRTERTHIRRIDEVDADFERGADDCIDFVALLQCSDGLPRASMLVAAEGDGAEADFGNEQAGFAVFREMNSVG